MSAPRPLAPLPSLDALVQEPERVHALTVGQVATGLGELHVAQSRLAVVEGALVARLLALQAQPAPPEDALLDMPAVARMLCIPESKARELGRCGGLPTVQVGKYVRVSRRALEAFMADANARVDRRPYAAYGARDGRRDVPATPKARDLDTAGARRQARRHGEHGGPVGARGDAHHGADGAVDRPDPQGEA